MPRVLVADDDAIVRKGLKRFLEEESVLGINVDTTPLRDASMQAQRKRPDMVILDPLSSAADGFDLLQQFTRWKPQLPVLVYTHERNVDVGYVSVRMGASGYITKDRSWEELLAGLKKVLAGRRFITDLL